MHNFILVLHSIIRWLVVLLGIYVVFVAGRGWFGHRAWTERTGKYPKYWLILLDIQLLLGLLLYFVFSPITTKGFDYVLGNPASRFFLMEHSVMMLAAIVLAHIGAYLVKKAPPEGKFKRTFIFFGIALLLILVAIPWPFMPGYGRPLLF